MIYLSGCLNPPARAAMLAEDWLGVLNTPKTRYNLAGLDGVPWAADNAVVKIGPAGPYSDPDWDADAWLSWLAVQDRSALFAAVPDVVGDWLATQKRWAEFAPVVRRELGFRAAYVLQDGCPDFPFEAEAVFVGGSDEFKESTGALRLVTKAKALGKWAHMGRVNTETRCRLAASWGCDSVDGTFLGFGPDTNLPRMRRYMQRATVPRLFDANHALT